MYAENRATTGEMTAQERRDAHQNDKRILGYVVRCDGSRATSPGAGCVSFSGGIS